MFYIGIVQHLHKFTKGANEDEADFKFKVMKHELLEEAEFYTRSNLVAGSHETDSYISGEGSSDKVTWMKMSCEDKERFFIFANFSDCVKSATVWIQGPSSLDLYPEYIEKGDYGQLRFIFSTLLLSNQLHTEFFGEKMIKLAVKILSCGFGILYIKNLTSTKLVVKVSLEQNENISLSKF